MSFTFEPEGFGNLRPGAPHKGPMSRMMAGLLAYLRPAEPAPGPVVPFQPQADDLKSAEFDRLASLGSWTDLRESLRSQDQAHIHGTLPPRKAA